MTTQHFVDDQGKYIGGFGNGAEPPTGSIEVPAPKHGRDVWDGGKWIEFDHAAARVDADVAAVLDSNIFQECMAEIAILRADLGERVRTAGAIAAALDARMRAKQ